MVREWPILCLVRLKPPGRDVRLPTLQSLSPIKEWDAGLEGQIIIATEAEGINLQFCSLVVNYDLPWNPQCIEQRIGRCHRYGQAHDVMVVNFLKQKNAADQRVFQLLSEKSSLFEGVSGASDEVLGAILSAFPSTVAQSKDNSWGLLPSTGQKWGAKAVCHL